MSFGAMAAFRESRSLSIRECFLHARRAIGTAEPAGEAFEVKVYHWRRIKRQPLRDEQPAHDCDAERLAQFRATATTKSNGHRAEQSRKRRHHDRPEAQQARLMDRLLRALAFEALGLQREVDHHDR